MLSAGGGSIFSPLLYTDISFRLFEVWKVGYAENFLRRYERVYL